MQITQVLPLLVWGHCTVTGLLHPGGEAQYYLCLQKMIQVYDMNTAQLWEPGSCTAIDNTSDPTIIMGKPVITAFIFDEVHIPTEKVGCLQVTSQLQEFLNHFPPESIEKAFEQIYQILQVLDKYLIDNPQQHQHCMSPDSEYIILISYTTAQACFLYQLWTGLRFSCSLHCAYSWFLRLCHFI